MNNWRYGRPPCKHRCSGGRRQLWMLCPRAQHCDLLHIEMGDDPHFTLKSSWDNQMKSFKETGSIWAQQMCSDVPHWLPSIDAATWESILLSFNAIMYSWYHGEGGACYKCLLCWTQANHFWTILILGDKQLSSELQAAQSSIPH